jgi:hypothetical protein
MGYLAKDGLARSLRVFKEIELPDLEQFGRSSYWAVLGLIGRTLGEDMLDHPVTVDTSQLWIAHSRVLDGVMDAEFLTPETKAEFFTSLADVYENRKADLSGYLEELETFWTFNLARERERMVRSAIDPKLIREILSQTVSEKVRPHLAGARMAGSDTARILIRRVGHYLAAAWKVLGPFAAAPAKAAVQLFRNTKAQARYAWYFGTPAFLENMESNESEFWLEVLGNDGFARQIIAVHRLRKSLTDLLKPGGITPFIHGHGSEFTLRNWPEISRLLDLISLNTLHYLLRDPLVLSAGFIKTDADLKEFVDTMIRVLSQINSDPERLKFCAEGLMFIRNAELVRRPEDIGQQRVLRAFQDLRQ